MSTPFDNRPAGPSECFDHDWLELRRAADERARSARLTTMAGQWLQTRPEPRRLIDLGAGSGNNVAYLAARLPGSQRWLLIDHDAGLLAAAGERLGQRAGGAPGIVEIETSALDLSEIADVVSDDADLVCASALFDLVSADWVERLAECCRAAGSAVLFTLSVDGRWRFIDAHGRTAPSSDDRWAARVFNAHQQRDKQLGRALGPDAPAALIKAFQARDYRVATGTSPWRLEAGTAMARSLGCVLLDARADAMIEQAPEQQSRVADWAGRRRGALRDGTLGMEIGHIDLFARPD